MRELFKGSLKLLHCLFLYLNCSQEYRHPSCLIKHRWEHNPHWREASKLMLSKHQQVQLLEVRFRYKLNTQSFY